MKTKPVKVLFASFSFKKRKKKTKKNKHYFGRTMDFILCAVFAVAFLLPSVLTFTNSFMTESEINANYGSVFSNSAGGYVSKSVNLKFIPDKVSFSQYIDGLIKSPDYLVKFWNSLLLVVPIVVLQLLVASVAAYGFTRWRGKARSFLFFFYVILMLMPYQVTLVPNYLVSDWLHILNTSWAIILPGAFAPFSVFSAHEIYAADPLRSNRSRQSGRRQRVADFHAGLSAPVPVRFIFHCHTGFYRLLEHGGTAAGAALRRGQAAVERVPQQHQPGRNRLGLRDGDGVHAPQPAAVPARRRGAGGGHRPPGQRERITLWKQR